MDVTYDLVASALAMKPGADSKRVVPIVTGFLGRGEKTGLITTLGRGGSGAFCTLVPIRPRRRGGRRSLRTFAVVSLRPPLAFNPRPRRHSSPPDAFELHPDFRSRANDPKDAMPSLMAKDKEALREALLRLGDRDVAVA